MPDPHADPVAAIASYTAALLGDRQIAFMAYVAMVGVWALNRVWKRRPFFKGLIEYMFACGTFVGSIVFLAALYLMQEEPPQGCSPVVEYDPLFAPLGGIIVSLRAGQLAIAPLFQPPLPRRRPRARPTA